MDDLLDGYVTRKELAAMQAQWDAERKQRMLEAEKQLEREAKREAIRKRVRRVVTEQPKGPELNPDRIFDAGESLNQRDSDDWPVMVSGRKRKRTKIESMVTPEAVDPDLQPEVMEIEGLGRFVISTGEDEPSNSWALTYGT